MLGERLDSSTLCSALHQHSQSECERVSVRRGGGRRRERKERSGLGGQRVEAFFYAHAPKRECVREMKKHEPANDRKHAKERVRFREREKMCVRERERKERQKGGERDNGNEQVTDNGNEQRVVLSLGNEQVTPPHVCYPYTFSHTQR